MEIFLFALGLIWVLAAIAFDFKTREIPNWISFSLIAFALAYRAFVSITTWQDFFTPGLYGLAIFLAFGEIMCRSGFGGGDSKLLAALGTVVPVSLSFYTNLFLLAAFFFSLLILGAGYTLVYTIVLVSRSPKSFLREARKSAMSNKKYAILASVPVIVSAALVFFHAVFIAFLVFFVLTPLMFVYSKAVDEMLVKEVSARKLVPGDWLYENVRLGNKTLRPKMTGLDEKDIALIRRYKRTVKVKDGAPFTPSFLLALALLVCLRHSGWSLFNYYLGL